MPKLGEVHFCFSTWQVLSWKRKRSGIPALMDYKMTGRWVRAGGVGGRQAKREKNVFENLQEISLAGQQGP